MKIEIEEIREYVFKRIKPTSFFFSTKSQKSVEPPKTFDDLITREILIALKAMQIETPFTQEELAYPMGGYRKAIWELLGRGYQGERLTARDFQAMFYSVLDHKSSFMFELEGFKKDQLRYLLQKELGQFSYSSDKKDDLVGQVFNEYLELLARPTRKRSGDFFVDTAVISDVYNYDPVAITKSKIDSLTDEMVDVYFQAVKDIKEEKEQKKKQEEERLKDPQTAQDWKDLVAFRGGMQNLTPEETRLYDAAQAKEALEKKQKELEKQAEKKEQYLKELVTSSTPEGVHPIITKGFQRKWNMDIWIVTFKERIEPKDKFWQLVEQAKTFGGKYSKWDKGIVFGSESEAQKFTDFLSGKEETKQEAIEEIKVEAKSVFSGATEKLAEKADSLKEQAEQKMEDLSNKKVNTYKRQGEYASAYAEAEQKERFANILSSVAEAMKRGEIIALHGLRNIAQIDTLWAILKQGRFDYARQHGTGIDAENMRKEPFAEKHILAVKYPYPYIDKKDVLELVKQMHGSRGLSSEKSQVKSLVSSLEYGEYREISNDRAVDALNAVALDIKRKKHLTKNYGEGAINILNRSEEYRRLKGMGIDNEALLREALREMLRAYEGSKDGEREKRKEMALHQKIQRVALQQIPGYFPTPQSIVDLMIDRAELSPNITVLEPSAGAGHIADRIREIVEAENVDVIEYNYSLREILKEKGHRVVADNSLEYRVKYGAVLMNPPFENGQDIDHVRFAFDEQLQPGGRLVAIMSEGPFFRSDKKSVEFREWLDMHNGTSEELPEGAFKSSDRPTGVKTRLVVIDKER